jgi:3-hydroxymyristoyl/3-hydroxydecanoyl-(acyl carrier protein) dehydratase
MVGERRMRAEREIVISATHPALPGHFPGHPVVPGVVLLDEVIDTIRQAYGLPLIVRELPAAKLSSPVSPGERVTIRVEEQAPDTAVFSCHVGNRLVASGSVKFRLDVQRTSP